jgi:hypothetical protein
MFSGNRSFLNSSLTRKLTVLGTATAGGALVIASP